MTNKQHPAQFDWATELLDAEGHVTLSAKEAHEIGARLRSMGEKLKAYEDLDEAASDVQLLRMGYAAARPEIESLRARSAAPASEYPPLPEPVGKVEVSTTLENSGLRRHKASPAYTSDQRRAYVDRAMRAEQPAGAQQPGAAFEALPVTPQFPDHPEPMVMDWSALEISVIAQYGRDMYEAGKRASHGQAPTQAADSVLEDAARYRWLRIHAIGAFRTNNGNGPVSVYHLSRIPALAGIPEETDAAIDAARKQGANHDQ